MMKSPFKDIKELEEEIVGFINRYKTTVSNHAKRISDYFEMSCFNLIVRFYESNDYDVSVQNLQDGEYRYKCSPAGIQTNYSHFLVTKKVGKILYKFEIQHNLAAQSSYDIEIFTIPDILVIKSGKSKTTNEYYEINRRFSYVENKDIITFFEVKNFTPFPELIFNFMGVVNEIRKEIMTDTAKSIKPLHLAPSLMISGKSNKQTLKIKESLQERYCINILFDLFDSGISTFSQKRQSSLRMTGKVNQI